MPGWFRHAYFEYHAHVRLRFKLVSGLGEPWSRNGGIPQGCPLSMMLKVALYLPWCPYLSAQVEVAPQLYADNLKCVSGNPDLLLSAARLTTGYVRLVGQERAPSKCVLLSTSREVRKDMKDWVLSQNGDKWSVRFDVWDLGGHLDTTFRGVKKGSYRTAWAVPFGSSCNCSYAYGRGPAIKPHTGQRCWPLLAGVWRAIATLMKPWCAEGEVPTAANLNLYRGWNSCVGWHCDDEPLFRKCGDAKLTVSVSLGTFALFRWRRQSCPDDEGRFILLGHGDILVMGGQCQDEFLQRTDPGREQERINITFRWVKQHVSSCPLLKAGVACCLPTCAKGSSVPVMENALCGLFFFWEGGGGVGFFLVSCAYGES